MIGPADATWRPVAAEADLVAGHVFHGQLFGQELAIWRAGDDHINVWENRCPHRGVRLTIGVALVDELRCGYHGWRFASGTGACTQMPAHPRLKPPDSVRVRSFEAATALGLVWTRLSSATAASAPPPVGGRPALVLRALPIKAPASLVETALASLPLDLDGVGRLRWFVQPVAADRCIARGVVEVEGEVGGEPPRDDQAWRRATLRGCDHRLENLRRRVEGAR